MKILSPLFGFLGKATGARSNTPEEGDTRLTLLGSIQPVIAPPFPTFSLINGPVAGGTPPFTNSFLFTDGALFNASINTVCLQIGPGVWELSWLHWLEEAGAVSDATSSQTLVLLDQITGNSAKVSRITNKQGAGFQYFERSFRLTILVDAPWSISRNNVAGAGTGLNFGQISIFGARLF